MKLSYGSRPRYSPEQQAQLLKEFARNPGSAKAFAARQGIAVSTLYRWRHQRGSKAELARAAGHAPSELFEQVPLSEVLGTQWSGEVRLPDGTQVRWRHPTPVTTLQELLGYLRQPC